MKKGFKKLEKHDYIFQDTEVLECSMYSMIMLQINYKISAGPESSYACLMQILSDRLLHSLSRLRVIQNFMDSNPNPGSDWYHLKNQIRLFTGSSIVLPNNLMFW
jgi:hypothetical protein